MYIRELCTLSSTDLSSICVCNLSSRRSSTQRLCLSPQWYYLLYQPWYLSTSFTHISFFSCFVSCLRVSQGLRSLREFITIFLLYLETLYLSLFSGLLPSFLILSHYSLVDSACKLFSPTQS